MAIFKELTVLDAIEIPKQDRAKPMSPSKAREVLAARKPEWLKIRPPAGENYTRIKGLLKEHGLHTVCQEAQCPNLSECWASGTATFMLGGDTCTRACRFCAIKTARVPPPLDPNEPQHIAESVTTLGLKYVVLTSVDRDDLEDQGSNHFAETIRGLKQRQPDLLVEALVPDFRGELKEVEVIVRSGLDVYAHNIETVSRLQDRVRDPRAGYKQSLLTLRGAKNLAQELRPENRMLTKSAIMLGLGETKDELLKAFQDLRDYGVEVLTLGQYLRPSLSHLPVEKYYRPEEFEELRELAMEFGFFYVASGAMVRSSYKAAEFFIEGMLRGAPPNTSKDFVLTGKKAEE